MKTISNELAAHLSGEVLTLATCWKITRRDAIVFGFTDHDVDIIFDGITYAAATGFTPSAISDTSRLSVDNLDIEGMLSSSSISESDIAAGKYDFAEIEIFKINYADITQGVLKMRRGWLGEVSLRGNNFTAEVRGLTQALAQTIGELFSPSCRATLGDSRCKVNLSAYTVSGSITAVMDTSRFTDSGRAEATGVFVNGLITFTSGANIGLSMEIKEYTHASGVGGAFTTALPLPYSVAIGDSYTVVQGCDKTLGTCKQRFDNVINFRGEPHVPGMDKILQTAGTRGTN